MFTLVTNREFEEAAARLGISKLRPQQEAPIDAILDGRDAYVQLPTGGGKSAIYQLPAICWRGRTTVVISPLCALQHDQVRSLRERGIAAGLLNSSLSDKEYEQVLEKVQDGKVTLLYLAPEQLLNKRVRAVLDKAAIAMVVVDEAHVLARDQHDFRKAYQKVGDFIAGLPQRPIVSAFTATATKRDCKIIIRSLGMVDPAKFVFPIRRENLEIVIKVVKAREKDKKRDAIRRGKMRLLRSCLDSWDGDGSVIIYCPTVKEVTRTHKLLKGNGYDVGKFHGKMNPKKRAKAQAAFMSGKTPIMVATNAFGLGIDKPDVRMIIHVGLPLSLDGYVQEIGRAGRDGGKAACILIYAPTDYATNKALLMHATKKKRRCEVLTRLDALDKLIKSKNCIWKGIEHYFGEKSGKKCGKCCNCALKDLEKRT